MNMPDKRSVFLSLISTLLVASSAEDECGLYLAISSTATAEENTWGIYAGKDIPAGAPIGYPDIGINIPHLKANTFFAEYDGDESEEAFLGEMVDFLESNIWVPGPAGALYELDKGRSTAAIPGPGALAAFNPKLTNTDWNGTSAYVTPYWGEAAGKTHPNRGAVSQFYHVGMQSTSDIVAGSELFMDYGENWAEDEDEASLTNEDFARIDETVDDMIRFFEKHGDGLAGDAKQQVYNFMVKDVMIAAVGADRAHNIARVLPPRPDELYKVKAAGGALKFSEPTVYRKVEWLKQYGRCMDNIQPGPSTIENAGRGAFATRKIAKGGLVAPVPLVHIPDSAILDMHDLTPSGDGDYLRDSDEVVHEQLLMNYVYGHPSSSMVFYPTGASSSFINHGDTPNAKMVWSDHPSNSKFWFDVEPSKLIGMEYQHVGLMMEIVATKEIDEGDEVLIDYGKDWKEAWTKHQNAFEQQVKDGSIPAQWPLRAADMNDEFRNIAFKTESELAVDPYPETVQLKAFIVFKESSAQGTQEFPKEWGFDEGYPEKYRHDQLAAVEIIERREVSNGESSVSYNYEYLVKCSKKKKTIYVDNVPHNKIVFVDVPGTSDQFFTESFRHFIGIPDEIFPQGPWRNLE